MRLHPSASMEVPRRRNRPAHSRREQALRAEARTASRLLRGLAQLQSHRGSQPSRLGAALARALRDGATAAEAMAAAAMTAAEVTMAAEEGSLAAETRAADVTMAVEAMGTAALVADDEPAALVADVEAKGPVATLAGDRLAGVLPVPPALERCTACYGTGMLGLPRF